MKIQLNKRKASVNLLLFAFLIIGFSFSDTVAQNGTTAGIDTLFREMSIDELLKIREHYKGRVDELRIEEESYRQEGADWSENFLAEKGSQVTDRDQIYIRLSEYYIDAAEKKYDVDVESYDERFDEYDKQLELFNNNQIEQEPLEPTFPVFDYSKAIGVYDRLLDEYPASDYAADALYSKAWLMEKMNMGATSRNIYREVIDKYPDSPVAPESYMRLGEYYFSPRMDKTDEEQSILEIRKAIQIYKNVLKYRNSKRYDEALYKLGWSYYKLAARDPNYYNDAITYFLMVADDIERGKKLDPSNKITNPDVRDEAIEYIGISFTDDAYTTSGVDKARHMLQRINDRPYGPEIVESIGRTYKKIDEPQKAIYAYQTLLDMYPAFHRSPEIQQNVVESLFADGKDDQAYAARRKLYESYNPDTEWYNALDVSEVENKVDHLNAAYKYSEAALRTNLLLDLAKAEEMTGDQQGGKEYYEKVAEQCKTYLRIFPADSNAYDVNWSYALLLDSRLNQFDIAFEEYIRVSNDYLENQHQEDAAINAVGVADTLVKLKYGTSDTITFNLADVAKLSPESLTDEETRLVEAYDNYIRLFPTGEFTPGFLASAGGIYYNHFKFAEAKIYFQTLVRRFPGAEQKSLAMRSIMDSYFALGKFKDSEIIAKQIMNESAISDEQKEFARKRLGQAIFKNAEYLEEQGDFFTAASEYFRVYSEAPEEAKLVERALLNSGLNYQKSKDWLRAIASFDTLVTNYSQSQYAIPGLQNIADAYKELEQYSKSAHAYERIFNDFRESENADAALYNSGFYYKKGEDWNNAIRVNNLYIQTYPDQSYAVDLFFANADLYLKLDNVPEANKLYEQFAQRYPDDPRTVTAFYERGKYYLDSGQTNLAKVEFNKAIARSETFSRAGKDPNSFIAGEAVNSLAEILHREFVVIELKQPKTNIDANLARMRSLMQELNNTYGKVLTFGSPRSFEATYNTARTYEEFAQTFASQEIDPNLTSSKKFVEIKKVNESAAGLYEKAVEQYNKVIENIPLIAEKLGVDMYGTAPEAQPQVFLADSLPSEEEIKRVAEKDSTKELAFKWFLKAKDKTSELLYTQASITSENVHHALDVQAPQTNPVQRIIFRRALLSQAVAPAIKLTIDAHLHNIAEADKHGLTNKYVEESKRQILLTSNIMGSELEQITYSALTEFDRKEQEVATMIEQEFGTKNNAGLDYYGVDNDANQMIDYVRILSNDVLNAYANTLVLAADNNIQNDLTKNTQERLLRYTVELADVMSLRADSAKSKSEYYRVRFDSTENYNYDDGAGFYENYMYEIVDYSKEIMDMAFELQNEYEMKNLWANKLLLKLIQLDPGTYSASIEKDKIEIFSDPSWKYTTTYYAEQWTTFDFDDSGWYNAETIFTTDNQFAGLGVDPQSIWTLPPLTEEYSDSLADDPGLTTEISETDSLVTSVQDSVLEEVADSLVFFRKTFELNGTALEGSIYVTADNDFRLYLNGEYLTDDEMDDFMVLDTLDFYTIDLYLKEGKNVFSIDVEDKDLTGNGLKFYASFELLPADITAAAEEKAKVKRIFVEPELLRKINILNKNRISLKSGNN